MSLAAQRVLVILREIAKAANGIGVRELARGMGQSPSNVQKALQALLDQEFVCQDTESKRYLLGPTALQVGLAGLSRFDVRGIAREHLEALAQETGETAYLGVRHGDEVMYVEKVIGPSEIRVDAPIGARRPFNCTAAGKVLLASLPEQEFRQLAAGGAFVQRTPNSITDPAALAREMVKIREAGVAIDREEFALGVMCVAAPARNHEGATVAAIVLSGPAQRLGPSDTLIEQVKTCAGRVSATLGYRG